MLPDGFANLVQLVITNLNWDRLPRTREEVWDAFLYPIFLGATVRSAQANYVKEVLGDMLDFSAAQAVRTDPIWSRRAMAVIDAELGTIKGTLGEGYKKAILEIARKEIQSLNLSRTIGDALQFFEDLQVDVRTMRTLKDDERATLDFVDLVARSIHNVRYIKAVLWLYNCGIAKDLVPPNAHVTRFLNECGYPGFGWSKEQVDDWQIFTPACKCMKDVARQVETELGRTITAKQAQAAVWYLQTSRGLLPTTWKNSLTPDLLIQFLHSQSWSIGQLSDKLDDVEELDNLANDLKIFLR